MAFKHNIALFPWQPWLLMALTGYVIAEVYFLTLLVNSLYFAEHFSDFSQLEVMGRVISGAGLGLSALIGLSLNQRLNSAHTVKRISLKFATFILITVACYVVMKELYLFMERNASKPIVHCSILGNAANRVFTKGTLPDYAHFVESGGIRGFSHKQLVRLYLPLHVCMNDRYRDTLQASPTLEVELASMVLETGLPGKIARPAYAIYDGFLKNLNAFMAVVLKLDMAAQSGHDYQGLILQKRLEFEAFLESQSRYTKHDIAQLSEVYQCALSRTHIGTQGAPEQRFMLAVSQCLYAIARERFSSLPQVNKASDISNLEQDVAFHWARQFIASPENIPEQALDLMRKSFALVFLPTYAVLVSTFVVFICLAAYVRTRFLIRAHKLKKRVNPALNACLSPLVVVPFIWTAILLWLPRTVTEAIIFPGDSQSNWVRALQVTQRPLFYYYDLSLSVFSHLNIPVTIVSPDALYEMPRSPDLGVNLMDFAGYYDLQLCTSTCQSIRLQISHNAEASQAYYRRSQCATKLVPENGAKQGWFVLYEIAEGNGTCSNNRQWRIKPNGEFLDIEILDKKQVLRAQAQNLFI